MSEAKEEVTATPPVAAGGKRPPRNKNSGPPKDKAPSKDKTCYNCGQVCQS